MPKSRKTWSHIYKKIFGDTEHFVTRVMEIKCNRICSFFCSISRYGMVRNGGIYSIKLRIDKIDNNDFHGQLVMLPWVWIKMVNTTGVQILTIGLVGARMIISSQFKYKIAMVII